MKYTRCKKIFIFLLMYDPFILAHQPIVYIPKYLGLLGNQLFQFCLGKILSKELTMPLVCPPIYGFPETYLHNKGAPSSYFPTQQLTGHKIDFIGTCSNTMLRNIILSGIFVRYEYYKNYTTDIKYWLRFDNNITPQDPNDIVIHVRVDNPPAYLPFSYYEDSLKAATYNRIYLCTNEPNHPFIKKFKKYHPIIKTSISLKKLFAEGKSYEEIISLTLDDFKFITSFNKIVISQSTFSWWAAFLSRATEIYAPIPDKGYMSSQRPDLQWKVEEERYHYLPCTIDKSILTKEDEYM